MLNPGTLPPSLKPCTILPVLGIRGDPTCEMVCRIMCARLGWLWRHAKHAICKDRPKDILDGSTQTPPLPPREKNPGKKKTAWPKKGMVVCVVFEQFPKSKCWFGCSCDYYICSMILLGSEHIYDPKGERRQDGGCGLWLSQPVYASLG